MVQGAPGCNLGKSITLGQGDMLFVNTAWSSCDDEIIMASYISLRWDSFSGMICYLIWIIILGLVNESRPLHEKCPNKEIFLIRIFPHLDWIRRDTPYLFLFSLNAGKYGPEKTPYLDTFHAEERSSQYLLCKHLKISWRYQLYPPY